MKVIHGNYNINYDLKTLTTYYDEQNGYVAVNKSFNKYYMEADDYVKININVRIRI